MPGTASFDVIGTAGDFSFSGSAFPIGPDQVKQQCGEKPRQVSGDSGFFSLENLQALEERQIDAYLPDSNLARWLNRGGRLRQAGQRSGRTKNLSAAQGDRGTGVRSAERTKRDAAVRSSRVAARGGRTGSGGHRVQLDQDLAGQLAAWPSQI
jgi:hypothetical protein